MTDIGPTESPKASRAETVRVNVGCGPNPTPGWVNIDNSTSVLLARLPKRLTSWLAGLRLLEPGQAHAVDAARVGGVTYGNATRLPLEDGSVDVLYSSHMLEHLDRSEADRFISECLRVIRSGGWLRLVVPDLSFYVEAYNRRKDADELLEGLFLSRRRVLGVRRLADVLVGFRGHRWMYDELSLAELVRHGGFESVEVLDPGETRIPDILGLDLSERAEDSIFLEARRP